MYWLILIGLVLLIGLWASADIARSVATAKQAEATVETAKAAQIASTGNLVTILVMALLVLIIVALAALMVYAFYRLKLKPALTGQPARPVLHQRPANQPLDMGAMMNQLVQLETLRMLRDMHKPDSQVPDTLFLNAPDDEEEPVIWR